MRSLVNGEHCALWGTSLLRAHAKQPRSLEKDDTSKPIWMGAIPQSSANSQIKMIGTNRVHAVTKQIDTYPVTLGRTTGHADLHVIFGCMGCFDVLALPI